LRKRPALALAAALALLASSCGKEKVTLAPVCTESDAKVLAALRSAPGAVALAGDVPLSECIDHARSDADLQSIGFLYGNVARTLAERLPAGDAAAVQLGFLIGAVRRGAAHSNGIHAELVRRLEQSMGIDGPPPKRRAAFERGMAAGESRG
jgi:hypothetical protein